MTLRDKRGQLLDESFYTPLPKAKSTQGQPIKEETERPASIPVGVPFQMNDSFTIEVERVKFVREKVSHYFIMLS
jgi:hypothetical protein